MLAIRRVAARHITLLRPTKNITQRIITRPFTKMPSATSEKPTTTGKFNFIDPSSYGAENPNAISIKPWTKVDGGGSSFDYINLEKKVNNIRPNKDSYTIDNAGFATYQSTTDVKPEEFLAANDKDVREKYYPEVEALLRSKLDGIAKVVIFDHTVRVRNPESARQPVQQVHVDQTPSAVEVRIRRHLPKDEAEQRLTSGARYQLINVWRPIGHAAVDFPLAVIDWRSTSEQDLIPVDLLYPDRKDGDDDDRGKEVRPVEKDNRSSKGYLPKGETYCVRPNDNHKLYYVKDMRPDETLFIKCFDSWGQNIPGGKEGIANCTPHTAFQDPDTPAGEKGRQSIEVRCLVFYEK